MVGENEKMYSTKDVIDRLPACTPSIRAETIPGAGHDLVFVHPDMITGKIISFLKEEKEQEPL